MGLKILHSADFHMDTPFSGIQEPRRTQLRQQLRRIPGYLAEVCRKEGIQLVLLCGDLFDGAPTRQSIHALREGLRECAVPVCIAPGNHDHWGIIDWNALELPENVYVFPPEPGSIAIEALDCRIWGCGYSSMDCPALLEGFHAQSAETYRIGLFHGDPINHNSPTCPITREQIKISGLHYLALGHIHQGSACREGSTLCAWPGSPMGRGWDETGDRGFLITEVSDFSQAQWQPTPFTRFYDLGWELSQPAPEFPGESDRDHYRLTLTGEADPDLSEIAQKFAHIPYLTLRDQTHPPIALWASTGEDTLEGMVFTLLQDALPEDPERAELAARLLHQLLEGREVQLP